MDWLEEISRRVGKAAYESYPGGYRQLAEDFNRMKEYIRDLSDKKTAHDPYGYHYKEGARKTPPDTL